MSPYSKRVTKNKTSRKTRKTCKTSLLYFISGVGKLNVSLAVVLLVGIFLYLVQVSNSTTKGFEISNLQKQVEVFKEQVRLAEQNVNELNSVEYIAREAESMNMVAVGQLEFLPAVSPGVALGD